MKLFVQKKLSKEKKPYYTLCADLGYRVAVLSMDLPLCVELSGKTFQEIANLKENEIVHIGNVIIRV